MNLKPIKTESDYRDALKRLELIFDAELGTKESDELDILGLMIMKTNITLLKHPTPLKQ